jgi:hypothetical protein
VTGLEVVAALAGLGWLVFLGAGLVRARRRGRGADDPWAAPAGLCLLVSMLAQPVQSPRWLTAQAALAGFLIGNGLRDMFVSMFRWRARHPPAPAPECRCASTAKRARVHAAHCPLARRSP